MYIPVEYDIPLEYFSRIPRTRERVLAMILKYNSFNYMMLLLRESISTSDKILMKAYSPESSKQPSGDAHMGT